MAKRINSEFALDCGSCPLYKGADGELVCDVVAERALTHLNSYAGINLDASDPVQTVQGYLW